MNLYMRDFRWLWKLKLTLSVFLLSFGQISLVSADTSANDSSVIILYPHASLEYHKVKSGDGHQFLISTPQRISNTLQIEKEVLLAGDRHDLLLNITSRGTRKAAFLFYQKLFVQQGDVLYSCEERGCGNSSYWANRIFNESKLYGRDGDQYYLAGRLSVNEKNYFVSVYIIQNGRRQDYIYLSYVLDKAEESGVANK
ncbi:MAG: hypothetical protein ACI84K_001339 [Pseudohongiellaceae bacterium]|jgi:hypothetical protein